MDPNTGFLLALLVVLIALSAFFSSTETAITSFNRIRMKNMAQQGDKRAHRVMQISQEYDKALSAILIGNNIVNIASASIGTVLFTLWIGGAGAGVSTLVMTVLVLIFGEVLPKSYAKQNADQLALKVSGILAFLIKVFFLVIWCLTALTNLISKWGKNSANEPTMTEEELKVMIEEIEDQGVIEQHESALVQSALEFDEIKVGEILTPRVNVLAVGVHTSPAELYDSFRSHHFSRIVVFEKNLDDIIGMIHQRDFLMRYVENQDFRIGELVREVLYIPETLRISELLGRFQARKIQMAVVADQYGGTCGIVTLEDILEELVGDIWDETDDIEHPVVQAGENAYYITGDMNVYDMFEAIAYEPKSFEMQSNTVNGWVSEILGHLPRKGDRFHFEAISITVRSVNNKKVTQILLIKNPPEK